MKEQSQFRNSHHFTRPLLILLTFLAVVLLLRCIQYLLLLQKLSQEDTVRFDWVLTEHSPTCYYSSQFFIWKIARCEQFPIGSVVEVIGRVDPTSDYDFYSKKRLIDTQIVVRQETAVSDDGWLQVFLSKIAIARMKLNAQLHALYAPLPGGVALSLILGNQQHLDPTIKHNFQTTGTLHILAVSGLHVGVIVSLLDRILSLVLRGKVKSAILWLLMTGYVMMVGFRPSVLRAWGMVTAALIARHLVGRQYNPLFVLLLVGIVLLVIRPDWLLHPGYQLSMAATGSIIILSKRLSHLVHLQAVLPDLAGFPAPQGGRGRNANNDGIISKLHTDLGNALSTLFQALKGSLVVSISAQLATFPLVLVHFGSAPILAFLPGSVLSLLASVLIPVVFLGSGVGILSGVVGFLDLQRSAAFVTEAVIEVFLVVLQAAGQFDWLEFTYE